MLLLRISATIRCSYYLKGSSGVFSIDSVVDISLESSTSEFPESNSDGHDLRDSGYSEFSQTPSSSISNNFNNLSYEDFDLPTHRRMGSGDNTNIMNISPPTISPRTQSFPTPPPIPPKAIFNPPSSLPAALTMPNSLPDSTVKTPNGTLDQVKCSSSIMVENSFGVSSHGGSPGSTVENYSVPRLQTQNSAIGDSPSWAQGLRKWLEIGIGAVPLLLCPWWLLCSKSVC